MTLSFMQKMPSNRALVSRKITLQPDEVLNVEPNMHSVHVLSGRAWVNLSGINISLASGNHKLVMKKDDYAMIFATSPVVIQVYYQPSR